MATSVWKGHISFGLISIPVRILRAARSERVPLRELYRTDSPAATDENEDVTPPSLPVAASKDPVRIDQRRAEPEPAPAPAPVSSPCGEFPLGNPPTSAPSLRQSRRVMSTSAGAT